MSVPHWRPAYIGIGSNLDSPSEQVERGIAALANIAKSLLVLQSGQYRSAPMGPAGQPDFANAVAAILTQLGPHELLGEMQSIELAHGRKRDGDRWGPRTLDLDLLSFSNQAFSDESLTLPHPGIARRNFVLLPWRQIAPHVRVPGLASVAELARTVSLREPEIERMSTS
ncbi:MAG: 2-amino-4-hydroxy-6-hydroxymethyldihydropteridine diphosphokinase [Woeseiaceae bacterium]